MVSTLLPSRMIVIESATAAISFSLWLIMMQVMPWLLNSRISSSRCAESVSFSAAVGSSRISSFTSLLIAFAISTSCCLPTPMLLIWVSGSSCRPTWFINSRAFWRAPTQSIPNRPRTSLPRKMFSAIESSGMSASSWWMITIPACSLERMFANVASLPS